LLLLLGVAMKKIMIASLVLVCVLAGVWAVQAKSSGAKSFNEVQVFRGDPPGKPYKVLGELNLTVPDGMSREQAVTLLKTQAFNEYKADAVINVVVGKRRTGGTNRRTICPQTSSDCFETGGATFSDTQATGTAIKWK